MAATTLISVDEYLHTTYDPDCDFVEGEVMERNVGTKSHAYAQMLIGAWFIQRRESLNLQPLSELRMRVTATRVRIPDIAVCRLPLPQEEVLTSAPYLCIEIMSPEDTIARMQDRLDDYLAFGVPNIQVIDPRKHRGWMVSAAGWAAALDGIMRTSDGRVSMPLADVLLP